MAGVPLPESVTIDNISGKWALDKSRSTGIPESLELQGVPWLLRKIINGANPVTNITHDGLSMTMSSSAPGVPVTTSETRRIDWTEREVKVSIFGTIKGASRYFEFDETKPHLGPYSIQNDVQVDEDQDDLQWLVSGWSAVDGKVKLIESQGKSMDQGWVSHQVWGFMLVDGERIHVRKLVSWNKGKKVRATMYHTYLGPATV